MLASAGQIVVAFAFFAVAQSAPQPVISAPATLTERAAASAHTPVVSLPDPRIIPFAALSAYFDTPPDPVSSTLSSPSSSSSSSSSLSAISSSATSAVVWIPVSKSKSKSAEPTTTQDSTNSPLEATSTSSSSPTLANSSPLVSASSEPLVSDPIVSVAPQENAQVDGASLIARAAMGSNFDLTADELFKRAPKQNGTWGARRKGLRIKGACVGSKANATTINSLLYYGGPGAVVQLCPNAVININEPIFFFAPNQVITTAGEHTGSTRATIVVQGEKQACAIYGAYPGADNVVLRNVQVNGNRPKLGIIWGGLALLEFGGNTRGQRVENVRSYEPRGWSAFHSAEGGKGVHACSGMQIIGNQMGPAGQSPTGVNQFRRRGTEDIAPGQWADGISHACPNSVVSGNTITDATDGAIVVFGAPGSTIEGNTIIANERVALGGINAVDYSPFAGSYEGTVIKNNKLIAANTMIKVGIAIGGMVWGVDNRTASRTFGGTFINNEFSSGPKGYFAYGIGVAGHNGAVIQGNKANNANFGGVDSPSCFSGWFPLPKPQPWIADPYTTPDSNLQEDFWLKTTLVLLICKGPGSILSRISSGAA